MLHSIWFGGNRGNPTYLDFISQISQLCHEASAAPSEAAASRARHSQTQRPTFRAPTTISRRPRCVDCGIHRHTMTHLRQDSSSFDLTAPLSLELRSRQNLLLWPELRSCDMDMVHLGDLRCRRQQGWNLDSATLCTWAHLLAARGQMLGMGSNARWTRHPASSGIPPKNVQVSQLCTAHLAHLLLSFAQCLHSLLSFWPPRSFEFLWVSVSGFVAL